MVLKHLFELLGDVELLFVEAVELGPLETLNRVLLGVALGVFLGWFLGGYTCTY